GFSPTAGNIGTAVTVTGTNFETAYASNKPFFNMTRTDVSGGSATVVNTVVPTATASGHIAITTPVATAVSAGDFLVPPSPSTPSDIGTSGRFSIGSNITVSLPTANKIGLMLFDGTAGQRISLGVSNVTIDSTDLTILNPNGSTLTTGFTTTSGT